MLFTTERLPEKKVWVNVCCYLIRQSISTGCIQPSRLTLVLVELKWQLNNINTLGEVTLDKIKMKKNKKAVTKEKCRIFHSNFSLLTLPGKVAVAAGELIVDTALNASRTSTRK